MLAERPSPMRWRLQMRFSSPTLMPNYSKTRRQTMRKITMALLTVLFTLLPLAGAYGQAAQPSFTITPPPLPDDLAPVPAGNKLFLGTHAVGTQNYVCKPSGAGVAYVLFTPQATLFGEDGGQVITHDFTPNPFEPNTDPKVVAPDGTIRATWQ